VAHLNSRWQVVAARLPGGTKIVCITEHLYGNYSVRQLT